MDPPQAMTGEAWQACLLVLPFFILYWHWQCVGSSSFQAELLESHNCTRRFKATQ